MHNFAVFHYVWQYVLFCIAVGLANNIFGYLLFGPRGKR